MFTLGVFIASFICILTFAITMPNSLSRIFSRKRRVSDENYQVPGMPERKIMVQKSRLLNLPDELLISIVSFLDEKALHQVRLTSTHLNELALPLIFETWDILRGRRSSHLATLILMDPRRAQWLRSILVSTRHDEDRGLDRIPRCLRDMHNLKNLVLETPDCNARSARDRIKWVNLQKQYEAVFRDSSVVVPKEDRLLPILESCTLHFVDEMVSLYPLTKYSSIFLHPTLKSLTLSCACTDHPKRILSGYRQYKRTTSLEHLHLEECDFDADSLEILLKFPKALKSLKMSEGVRYDDDRGRLHGNLNPGLLSYALSQSVASSLESLSVSLGYQRSRTEPITSSGRSLDLTALTRLKRLDVSMKTLGLIITRPKCDHATYRRLPPSVEHIRVFGIPLLILRGHPLPPLKSCMLKQKLAHGLPNLQQISYCYEYQAVRGNSSFGLINHGGEETLTRFIEASRKRVIIINNTSYPAYTESGVRVVVELETTPAGYIPPYLHNEEHPTREVIWDSNAPTFEALCFADKARQAARTAAMAENTDETSGLPAAGTASASADDSDSSDDENEALVHLNPQAANLFHLHPQAADLFELMILQPGQPFQI